MKLPLRPLACSGDVDGGARKLLPATTRVRSNEVSKSLLILE